LDSDSSLSGAITINNKGIHLKLRIQRIERLKDTYLAILPCMVPGSSAETVRIYVKAALGTKRYFTRIYPTLSQLVSLRDFTLLKKTEQLLCFQRESQIISESQLPFERAFKRGNEKPVKFLLEKGANFGFQCEFGPKLVFKAIEDRDNATVKLFLENGANSEWRDDAGHTALILAAQTEHEGMVKLLLEKGANIESEDDEEETALSWAAAYGDEAVVKLLLEKGANPESRNILGRTPLSLTAENEAGEAVVKLLLEKGANPESRCNQGRTPLDWAAENGNEAIVRLLLEKVADPESRDEHGSALLSSVVGKGHSAKKPSKHTR
jgi:ankyrin repeat protein